MLELHRENPRNEAATKRFIASGTSKTRRGSAYKSTSLQEANPKGEDVVVPQKPEKRIYEMSDTVGNSGSGDMIPLR